MGIVLQHWQLMQVEIVWSSCAVSLQVLVLVSPYSWLPAWTPKELWLGGFTGKVGRACVCGCTSCLCRVDISRGSRHAVVKAA